MGDQSKSGVIKGKPRLRSASPAGSGVNNATNNSQTSNGNTTSASGGNAN
jgi:hypothetical protein